MTGEDILLIICQMGSKDAPATQENIIKIHTDWDRVVSPTNFTGFDLNILPRDIEYAENKLMRLQSLIRESTLFVSVCEFDPRTVITFILDELNINLGAEEDLPPDGSIFQTVLEFIQAQGAVTVFPTRDLSRKRMVGLGVLPDSNFLHN